MATHHFDKSLRKEGAATLLADAFYRSPPFAVSAIERYNQHTKEHLILQRQDIDLSLHFEKDRSYTVSEKFREYDYNDLLLEIYSKYPTKKGWVHNSHADRLAYFFPKRMFWIDKKALCAFCLHDLFPRVETDAIDRLLSQEHKSLKVGVRINNNIYYSILTQAFNNTDGDVWNTISISVPFRVLQDFRIRFQSYRL